MSLPRSSPPASPHNMHEYDAWMRPRMGGIAMGNAKSAFALGRDTTASASGAPGVKAHHQQLRSTPAYYVVQSPSRDSRDQTSVSSSNASSRPSTPHLTPLGSPFHPMVSSSSAPHTNRATRDGGPRHARIPSYVDARSSISSSSHVDATMTNMSGYGSTESSGRAHHKLPPKHPYHRRLLLHDTIFEVDDDEEFESDPDARRRIDSMPFSGAQIYKFLVFSFFGSLLLGLFVLVFWFVCKPSAPIVSVKVRLDPKCETNHFSMSPNKLLELRCVINHPKKLLGCKCVITHPNKLLGCRCVINHPNKLLGCGYVINNHHLVKIYVVLLLLLITMSN